MLGSSDVPKYASESDLQTIVDEGKATLYYISYAPAREGGCYSETVKKQLYQTPAMCAFITSYRDTYGTEESSGPSGNPDNSPGLSYDSSDAMLGNDALQTVVQVIDTFGSPDIDGAEALRELDSGKIAFDGASGYISFPAHTQAPPNHPMYITSLGNTLTLKVSCGEVSGAPGGAPVVQRNSDCPTAS